MSRVCWIWSFILVYNKLRVYHVGNHWIVSFCGSCYEFWTHCSTLHRVKKEASLAIFGFYTFILNFGFPLHCQIAYRLVYGGFRCSSVISYCVLVPSQWCMAVQIHVWCLRCVMSDFENLNPCLDSILKASQALVILNVAVPTKRWLCKHLDMIWVVVRQLMENRKSFVIPHMCPMSTTTHLMFYNAPYLNSTEKV